MEFWRLIDTGLRSAAQNIALNRALLEARDAEEIPSTLRFLRFAPSALLGYRQSAEQALNLAYCHASRIAVQRRITGGGATYCDPTQLGWELYLHKRDVGTNDMQAISRRVCHAVATAVSALGVDARYRPRNDVEVNGRKISDAGGMFEGDALLFQGTLLVDCDFEEMLRVLRTPAGEVSDKAIESVRERIASLTDLLGRQPDLDLIRRNITEAFESEFEVEFRDGDVTLSEHARYQTALAEIDTPGWVNLVSQPASGMPRLEAAQKSGGGLLRAVVAFDTATQTVCQVWFDGDISVSPRRTIADLEAALRDTPVGRLEARIRSFFAGREVELISLTPHDFLAVLQLAVRQRLITHDP